VDDLSAAWLLYSLCSTHEFDEHPVRHNEEHLNEELSRKLKWGPDTSQLLSSGSLVRHNPTIFQDPHTKCFLLLQAFLEGAPLPISDYVNDTKTVTENIPRLLAAFHFIARHQEGQSVGSMELLTQFARTRQLFSTKSMADIDPLLQLPHLTNATVQRLRNGAQKGTTGGVDSLYGMRCLARPEAAALLRRAHVYSPSQESLDQTLDALYRLPRVLVKEFAARRTGKTAGELHLELDVEFESAPSRAKTGSTPSRRTALGDQTASSAFAASDVPFFTLTILVGTERQGLLLAHKSVTFRAGGGDDNPSRSRSVDLTFDWEAATRSARRDSGTGTGGGSIVMRLLWEEVRGLDSHMLVRLDEPTTGVLP
jgi:hypothetical protein